MFRILKCQHWNLKLAVIVNSLAKDGKSNKQLYFGGKKHTLGGSNLYSLKQFQSNKNRHENRTCII